MEVDPDFDPTPEEGQTDINDEEYESLIPNENVDPQGLFDKLRRRFGDRARSAWRSLGEKWKSRNQGRRLPEYLQLKTFDTLEDNETPLDWLSDPIDRAKNRLSELYENFNFDEVKLSEKDGKVYIRLQNTKTGGWTKPYLLFTQEGEVTAEVKRLKGFEMASRGLLERFEHVNKILAEQRKAQELQNQIEELQNQHQSTVAAMEKTHGREKDRLEIEASQLRQRLDGSRLALDDLAQELGISNAELSNLKGLIEETSREKDELAQSVRTLEEQIRQRDQAIEDLEDHIGRLREKLNDPTISEEEKEALSKEIEEKQERLDVLNAQIEKNEKQLGLTTKEKIKRALLKYGVPAAFAVAIAGSVAAIMTALKGLGNGVKKLGRGLTELGKKMAASVPGLLGSVLSLVLRTGGELLKFVGNNIWILVVAVGAILLKKLKI